MVRGLGSFGGSGARGQSTGIREAAGGSKRCREEEFARAVEAAEKGEDALGEAAELVDPRVEKRLAKKKRVAWSSSGSDDDTSTRYDVMLSPHAFLAADQCTTTCEPLSFGSDQRSSWSAGCSVKNPSPAESQKPISMAPVAAAWGSLR